MKISSVLLTATIATAVLLAIGAAGASQLPSSATAQDITADDPVGLGRLKVCGAVVQAVEQVIHVHPCSRC